jgi:hypothetical protein
MRASKQLISSLAKFNGIDVALFESNAEWNLADECLVGRMTDVEISRLEALASRMSPGIEN